MRHVVRANDHIEGVLERRTYQPPDRSAPQLARHEPERAAPLFQGPHRLDHAVVRTHHLVVVRQVVGPVGGHHRFDLGRVFAETAELHPQRCAQPFHPDVVRGLLPAVRAQRVAVRPEDELDRVDERAVQVEQESGERHARR